MVGKQGRSRCRRLPSSTRSECHGEIRQSQTESSCISPVQRALLVRRQEGNGTAAKVEELAAAPAVSLERSMHCLPALPLSMGLEVGDDECLGHDYARPQRSCSATRSFKPGSIARHGATDGEGAVEAADRRLPLLQRRRRHGTGARGGRDGGRQTQTQADGEAQGCGRAASGGRHSLMRHRLQCRPAPGLVRPYACCVFCCPAFARPRLMLHPTTPPYYSLPRPPPPARRHRCSLLAAPSTSAHRRLLAPLHPHHLARPPAATGARASSAAARHCTNQGIAGRLSHALLCRAKLSVNPPGLL